MSNNNLILEDLRLLKQRGLRLADCIRCFGVYRDEDPYAKAAYEKLHKEGELEIDSWTVVSGSDDNGDYVMAWVWITDEEAGVSHEPND